MTVLQEIIAPGHPNRPGVSRSDLKAAIFHYTANDRVDATDTMNARYFGRKYIEKVNAEGTRVYYEIDGVTPFRYGSTQVIADMDSITQAIPTIEGAWAAGDRNKLPWTPELKGQQPAAKNIFDFKQNFESLNIEICSNDVIKGSDEDWKLACSNAKKWTAEWLRSCHFKVDIEGSLNPQEVGPPKKGYVYILRHFDVTGKVCPKPFVDDPAEWEKFVRDLGSRVNEPAIEM